MQFNRFSLFKDSRHQQFEFHPRYYDPIKEELKERVRRAKLETIDSNEPSDRKKRLAQEFELLRTQNRLSASRQKRRSNYRFIFILAALSYICYKILTSISATI